MRTIAGLLGLVLSLLIVAAGLCHGASSKTVQVIGAGECTDCQLKNIKTSHAFSGLGVTIDCKLGNGELKRRASGELDKQGRFKVSLPHEILSENGSTLKEDCYAQLHGASGIPCSSHNGMDSSKIFLFTTTDESSVDHHVTTFRPSAAGKLKFSSETCTSAFLWPYYKYPPLPKHPWFHKPLPKWKSSFPLPLKGFGYHPKWKFPPISFPPLPKKPCPPFFKKPLPPPAPIYKKPLPPPAPIYVKPLPPPAPIYVKPLPPPVPIYKKPCPPIYKKPLPPPAPIYVKPLPPPVPVYKKPCPPPVPVYKKPLPPPVPVYKKPLPPPVPVYKKPLPPPVPVYKKPLLPPVPIYKKPCPPIHKKPLPPLPKFPPVYKKPLPPFPPIYKKPLPPFPPIYKKPLPPFPKFPPIYKKPLPPLAKFPPIYKKPCPPVIPKIPPKFLKHPKFKHLPALPFVPPHP